MMKIALTQGKFSMFDECDYDRINQYKWRYNLGKSSNGYATRTVNRVGKVKELLMHREIIGAPDGSLVDHVNGDGLDNRRENLRLATRQQNAFNQAKRKNNSSGFKGVSWHQVSSKWQARIRYGEGQIHIGIFSSAEDAAAAYDRAAIKYHGEFAILNFKELGE